MAVLVSNNSDNDSSSKSNNNRNGTMDNDTNHIDSSSSSSRDKQGPLCSSDAEQSVKGKHRSKRPSKNPSSESTRPSRSSSTSSSKTTSRSSSSLKKRPSSSRLGKQQGSRSAEGRNINPNPNSSLKDSLAKECERRPGLPPALGNIDPLGISDLVESTHTVEDASLRWNSLLLQNSPAGTATTAASSQTFSLDTACSSSNSNSNSRTIVLLPTNLCNNSSSSNHSSTSSHNSNKHILVADADVMLVHLLQAMQQDTNSEEDMEKMANRLHHAMHKLIQTATENGTVLVTGEDNNGTSINNSISVKSIPGNQNPEPVETKRGEETEGRIDIMHKQVQDIVKGQQLLLDFQKDFLQEKVVYEQRLQQQERLIQHHSDMFQQQQQQIQQLLQKMNEMHSTTTRNELPQDATGKQEEDETAKKRATLNDFGASLQAAESLKQPQSRPPPDSFADSFVVFDSQSIPKDTYEHEYSLSIGIDCEDDGSDFRLTHTAQEQISSSKETQTSESTDIWVCPSCNFEHEIARLQFCGVCGASRLGKNTVNEAISFGTDLSEEQKQTSITVTFPVEKQDTELKYSPIPPPVPEPLIQLQRHEELQKFDETPRDLPPKSPMRLRRFERSKSTTDINMLTTPRRIRPRLPPRNKTQTDDHLQRQMLNATYHGQTLSSSKYTAKAAADDIDLEGSLVIKCLDKEDGGPPEVFDIDMLHQQLSTFDSNPVAPIGTARTDTAPKTPKINKRKNIRRSKSALDAPDDLILNESSTTLPAPAFAMSRASLRQAIPRRAKSNSTEHLRMHQMQQQPGDAMVPPSPVQKRGILGAAVSALHKSPKKALSALKIAGNAVPMSLLLGGKDAGKDKEKNQGFLLDLDDGDNEAERKGNIRRDTNDDLDPTTDLLSPGRESMENRSRASLASMATSGWNKWFNSVSNHASQTVFRVDDDPGQPEDPKLEASMRDADSEAVFDTTDEREEENVKPRRRRNKSTERPTSRGRRDESEENRCRRDGNRGSVREGEKLQGASRRGSAHEKREPRERVRRTQSLEEVGQRDRRGSVSEEQRAKPLRDRLAKNTNHNISRLELGRELQENREREERLESLRRKAEQMKQRVEGLRKGTVETAAAQLHTSTKANAAVAAEDLSESTDGCTIYLENSIGDMSGVTSCSKSLAG